LLFREDRLSQKNKSKNGAKTPVSSGGISSKSPMDVGLLEQIVKLMSANDLNTVDVRDGDKRVILKRGAQFVTMSAPAGQPAAGFPPAIGASGSSGSTPAVSDESAGLIPIKSPMVGTFYAASAPDAKPFVSVGSRVDEETDVCVIEAMKVFNNIKAETKGTIAKVLVTNGQTVEFGQSLFLVKP
jgi:acetyl-CoA carboxylase biotin carboxyl carrier protein